MLFGSVVSSPRDILLPTHALELANIYLENARRATDPYVALTLCHDTEVSLSQTKGPSKRHELQVVREGVATAYIKLGRLLNTHGRRDEAQACYKKAEKLGHTMASIAAHGNVCGTPAVRHFLDRMMRKENYMIAMFNKELLNLSPPLSFLHGRTVLTRILEWSLGFCVLGFVFERGQVRKRFLKDVRRSELVDGFVAFISGSVAAVLALLTIFDQELLLRFEITSEKAVFFYLGLFRAIMAVTRGMIPDQTEISNPESLLREVVEHTHYMPNEWRDKLHMDEVREQFALLFEYKAVLFLVEFMSLVLTPLILCFSLSNCSEKIVDFSESSQFMWMESDTSAASQFPISRDMAM
ncbi:MAG: autophagy protein Apg9-domain-containing protein [Benniella sp.]|nr:MAG: autophagy protein Apg9-domain-containing protein [Benniella sp.]